MLRRECGRMFMQLLANGLVTGSVIALAAAGISIVYGILRLVNFAYGDYMTFGAFAGILFNVKLGLPIVLALVLRHVIYLVAGPQPRTYAVDPYKVYVIGSARLSGAQGIAIVVSAVGIVLIG